MTYYDCGTTQKELIVLGKLYTDEEKEFIRANYAEMGAIRCAEELGRPRNSVQAMAQKLGVRQYTSKAWSEAELKFLRDNFPLQGSHYCAAQLERAYTAVQKMADKLGVARAYKGYYIDQQGYKVLTPNRETKVYEHRQVMENRLGRPLLPSEIVHHRDGDKGNNDPKNLELTSRGDHIRTHHEEILSARWNRTVKLKR